MGHGILLEAGTNEMELLVFRLKDTRFGVNVAKVRELIQRVKTIAVPNAPREVEGSFQLRDQVLTLVHLGRCLDMEGEETLRGEGLIIIVEFSSLHCGVLVDAVEGINRIRWENIEPPSDYLSDLRAPLTGVAHVGDDIVLIADFETIIGQILGFNTPEEPEPEEQTRPEGRAGVRVLLAEDSGMIRRKVVQILEGAGFPAVTACSDGKQAWDTLEAATASGEVPFELVLTDIEMPRMDGLHLTSRIKGDPKLKALPVVLFSSLISDDNMKKGAAVGADAQVTKLEVDNLLAAIDSCFDQQP